MFTDPAARSVLIDWEAEASALRARFRTAADRYPHEPGFIALIEELQAASPEARAWWARHDIAPLGSGTKRRHHPDLGDLTFEHVVLQLADDPDQKFVTFTADDAGQERIAGLIAQENA